MINPKPPQGSGQLQATNLQLQGGAAIVAPVTAFPSGVPGNALIVLPLSKPGDELTEKLKQGPVAVNAEQMWKLLGFNGPAVQVMDAEGRPIAIGLEDLLTGLEKHWQENKDDLNRGRLFAQELMRHGRHEKAEKVLSKVVANGGGGEDWLGLGLAQLNQQKWDQAEGTLKGAANLLPDSPFPALHLARVYKGKQDSTEERAAAEQAIHVDPNCVDAWGYLFSHIKDQDGEEAAVRVVTELAEAQPNKKSAAPYVALQGFYAGEEKTRDRAIEFARQAVDRNDKDPLALVCLSALHGQKGDLKAVVELLRPAEPLMARDVRLANNYFEALFQMRDIERVTKLLNALAGSQNREVKQFAIERSRAVAQFLQKQQAELAKTGRQQ
ncbi:tetratricopeptide repeat protein [Myxococcota bacterium]